MECAHAIASNAGNIGMQAAHDAARKLEHQAGRNESDLASNYEELAVLMQRGLQEAEKLVAKQP